MNPFDQTWALLKMPVYETGVPGIQFVTQGADDPHWRSMDNVHGFVPTETKDGSEVLGRESEIQYMTPGEYGEMTTGDERGPTYEDLTGRKLTAREVDDTFYQEMMDRAQAGEDIKFGMPYVWPNDDPYVHHEGRHRMSELFARGHGDTPMPVKVIKQDCLMNPFDQAWAVLKMPQEARAFAEQQHEGQMYGEEPYMTHVDAVASQFDDPHMQRIAYLHDTVEDGKIGIDDIHEHFGEDVGHAVDAMTRRQGESYFDYIARVGEHPEARRVKMADLTHNLSGDPPGSLRQRYEKALEMLS